MFTRSLAILTLVAITVSPAIAQQPHNRPPNDPPHQAPGPGNAPDAETLRKRLLHTLEFAKRIVEKNEAALEQLQAGVDPREVMRALRTPERHQMMRNIQQHAANLAGNPDQPGAQHQSPSPELLPREIRAVRGFIKENLGDIDSQLQRVEKLSPEATKRLIIRLSPKVLEIMRLGEFDPELATFKLDDLKAGLLYVDASRKYRDLLRSGSTDEPTLAQAEQNVRNAATARFDAQVNIKQHEIQQLQARVNELHQALDNLNSQREDQVDAQVQAAARTSGPRREHRAPAQNDPNGG